MTPLEAFNGYLRLSCGLSDAVVAEGFNSELANKIRERMTIHWHLMNDSSREVCGLVNEEFNRLEAML